MDAKLNVEYYILLDWDIAFYYELKVVGRKVSRFRPFIGHKGP